MKPEDIIKQLELNKDKLEEKEQRFVESVAEQFYAGRKLSFKQLKWLQIYYLKISQLKNNDYGEGE